MQFDHQVQQLVGEHGMLPVAEQDEVTKKLAMLIEGDRSEASSNRILDKHAKRGTSHCGLRTSKKLYQCRPRHEPQPPIDTWVSRKRRKPKDCDPASIERGVRQLLADKVRGNLAGIWLLVAEHLRLAMQLVHEAAVCTSGIRAERTLHNRAGFELANGLPFVATDQAIHHLLGGLTVANAMELQIALRKTPPGFRPFSGKTGGD